MPKKRHGGSQIIKIRVALLGVPIIQTIVFWGLYGGLPPFYGNYHIWMRVGISQQSGEVMSQPLLVASKRTLRQGEQEFRVSRGGR